MDCQALSPCLNTQQNKFLKTKNRFLKTKAPARHVNNDLEDYFCDCKLCVWGKKIVFFKCMNTVSLQMLFANTSWNNYWLCYANWPISCIL